MRATIRITTIVLAVLLALAACSGRDGSPAARRSAIRWATAVCADLRRWADAASGGSPTSAARAALVLRAEIARIEPPDSDDGLAAHGEMEKLATAIERRVRGGNRSAINETVTETRDAVDGIRGLTPGGAVAAALADATPCRALRG